MLRVVLIISQSDWRDEELLETYDELKKAGIVVDVAGEKLGVSRGKFGSEFPIELKYSEIEVKKYDAIVFIGGPGVFGYLKNALWHSLANQFYQQGKLVAAICLSPAVLALAGLLKDRRATISPSAQEYLQQAGAVFIDEDVVIDGQFITGNGPAATMPFSQAVISYLKKLNK